MINDIGILADLENAKNAATAAERAAVVAFLRETLATSETAYASDEVDLAIDIIERGEHRREGGRNDRRAKLLHLPMGAR